jgi:hypothetical protein
VFLTFSRSDECKAMATRRNIYCGRSTTFPLSVNRKEVCSDWTEKLSNRISNYYYYYFSMPYVCHSLRKPVVLRFIYHGIEGFSVQFDCLHKHVVETVLWKDEG